MAEELPMPLEYESAEPLPKRWHFLFFATILSVSILLAGIISFSIKLFREVPALPPTTQSAK